jgi:hypothetical protein
MKNGVERIYEERLDQLNKHGKTVEYDHRINCRRQLFEAAQLLLIESETLRDVARDRVPTNWDPEIWTKMFNKPLKERLIIAGALLAAEYDRMEYNEKLTAKKNGLDNTKG